jgi:hypothetical protein
MIHLLHGTLTVARQVECPILAHVLVELREAELFLAFVAEHLDDGGAAFFICFHAGIVAHLHDVHLQGLDQKIPVVPAVGTGQSHLK